MKTVQRQRTPRSAQFGVRGLVTALESNAVTSARHARIFLVVVTGWEAGATLGILAFFRETAHCSHCPHFPQRARGRRRQVRNSQSGDKSPHSKTSPKLPYSKNFRTNRTDVTTNESIRSGFTLLEMLVTVLLTVVLMSGVWALATIFTRLFESGDDRVEEAQLIRSLSQQLTTDLLGIAAPRTTKGVVVAGATAGTGKKKSAQSSSFSIASSSSLPYFALQGTSQSLQIAVVDAVPFAPHHETSDTPLADEEASRPELPLHAPELQIVEYSFQAPDERGDQSPNERDENEAAPTAGLLREERPWETVIALATRDDATTEGSAQSLLASATSTPVRNDGGLSADVMESADDEFLDDSRTRVPEVVDLEFRYFDGQTWNSVWDSRQQRALPTAVEMTLRVMTNKERQRQQQEQKFLGTTKSEDADRRIEESAQTSETAEATGRTYRVLVYLPGGTPQQEAFHALGPYESTSVNGPKEAEF